MTRKFGAPAVGALFGLLMPLTLMEHPATSFVTVTALLGALLISAVYQHANY